MENLYFIALPKQQKPVAIRQVARSPQGVFRYGQFVMRDVRIVLEVDES